MPYPEQYRYTKEHQWVFPEGESALIGITHHAQEQLGDIVYVDLPQIGAAIVRGETFGSVESVKAVSDIFAPVSGTVLEVNPAITDKPEILNEDPSRNLAGAREARRSRATGGVAPGERLPGLHRGRVVYFPEASRYFLITLFT